MKWITLILTAAALLFAGCATNVEMPVVSSTHPAHPGGNSAPMMETSLSLNVAENPIVKRSLPIPAEEQAGPERAAMTMEMGSDHAHEHESPDSEASGANTMYACSIHPEVTAEKQGQCDLCGLPLLASRRAMMPMGGEMEDSTGAAAALLFVCPMHPKARAAEPGSCPICNMALVKDGGAGQ